MIHIAAASSIEYLPWCATMIRSCLDHHPPGELHFHFLDGVGIARADRERLLGMVLDEGSELTVHTIEPDRLASFPRHERFGGHVVWLRLLLPELLRDIDRVVYLDADTFVVDSLDPLWKTDLGPAPFGAIANVVEPAMWDHLSSLGIKDPRDVLNSGVLLLDLDALRRAGALEQLTRYVTENGDRLTWADQDALNVVFDRQWHRLHPRWNAQNSFWAWEEWAFEVFGRDLVEQARAQPAIVHFEGPHLCKPWHYLCQHEARSEYREARSRTPWGPASLEDRTVSTRAIRRLPERYQVPAYVRLLRWRERRLHNR